MPIIHKGRPVKQAKPDLTVTDHLPLPKPRFGGTARPFAFVYHASAASQLGKVRLT